MPHEHVAYGLWTVPGSPAAARLTFELLLLLQQLSFVLRCVAQRVFGVPCSLCCCCLLLLGVEAADEAARRMARSSSDSRALRRDTSSS